MRNLYLLLALTLLMALAGPAAATEPSWEMIQRKDGTRLVGTVTDATNQTYQITLFGHTQAVHLEDILTIHARANDLDAGDYLVTEAYRSLSQGNPERTMLLLKSGLRLLRDYVPTSDKEIAALNEATGRGYLLGGRLFIDHNQLEKARDSYRHVLVRYPKTQAAVEAQARVDFIVGEIDRRKQAAARKMSGNLSWSDLFDQEFPATDAKLVKSASKETTAVKIAANPPVTKVGLIRPVTATPPATEPQTKPESQVPAETQTKPALQTPPETQVSALSTVRDTVHRWMPLSAGNWWTYRLGHTEETLRIDSEMAQGEQVIFQVTKTVSRNGKTVTEHGEWILSTGGLFRKFGDRNEPLLVFPIDLKEDGIYNTTATEGNTTLSWRYTAQDAQVEFPERLQAKRRAFTGCLDVQMKSVIQLSEKSKIQVLSNRYYAPGIGLVKVSLTGDEQGEGKLLVDYQIKGDEP